MRAASRCLFVMTLLLAPMPAVAARRIVDTSVPMSLLASRTTSGELPASVHGKAG